MAEAKTKRTEASVADYVKRAGDAERQKDCAALVKMMKRAAKAEPKMWGTAIVGFGSYHYKYESGREGDSCIVGFASRKAAIVIYGLADFAAKAKLLAKLGKHEVSGGCLYVRRLDDVDTKVLEQLLVGSIAERKRRE